MATANSAGGLNIEDDDFTIVEYRSGCPSTPSIEVDGFEIVGESAISNSQEIIIIPDDHVAETPRMTERNSYNLGDQAAQDFIFNFNEVENPTDEEDEAPARATTFPNLIEDDLDCTRHFRISPIAERRRNALIQRPYITHGSFLPTGSVGNKPSFRIKPGDTVELGGNVPEAAIYRNGDFLRVHDIIEDTRSNSFFLRGWRFRRHRFCKGFLPYRLNEVVMILHVDADDSRPDLVQGKVTVPLEYALKKRNLVITNALYDRHSYRMHTRLIPQASGYEENKWDIECGSELVCRWIWVNKFADSKAREVGLRVTECSLTRITESQADPSYRERDIELVSGWRGPNAPPRKNYDHVDAFAGAGGVTEAATQALPGAKLGAFDNDPRACDTNRLNHPNVEFFQGDVGTVICLFDGARTKMLHISASCKFYSRANAQAGRRDPDSAQGQRDDENAALILSTGTLLNTLRPLLSTLEQADAILPMQRNKLWWAAVVQGYTSINYGVRFRIINFAEYGTPHNRKRLIMYGAAPGLEVPPFPEPTHGPGRQCGFSTIHNWITGLSPEIPHHEPSGSTPRDDPSYSPHSMLRHTITCAGTVDSHPSGTRGFTVRELARLQTLRKDYRFPHNRKTSIMQIGNMVPQLSAVKVLFEPIIKALERLPSNLRGSNITDETSRTNGPN